jgi:hypothetical protein
MSWMHVKSGAENMVRHAWHRSLAGVRWAMNERTRLSAVRSWSDVLGIATMDENASCYGSGGHRPCSESPMKWRRRALQRRGANIRMAMSSSAGEYALAMLDEAGIVISWHDGISPGQSAAGLLDDVIDDHMRQFYVLADVAADIPRSDLRVAMVEGTSTRQGWRRRAGGSVYWGTTIINAVTNRQGTLQGFSHLTRRTAGPSMRTRPTGPAIQQRRLSVSDAARASLFGARRQWNG